MFEHQLASIGFASIVLLLLYLEKARINKVITPFSVTAIPFVVIVLLSNFLLIKLKFPPVTVRAQFFILTQLVILWFAGYFISGFFDVKRITANNSYRPAADEFYRYDLIVIVLGWIAVLVVANKVLSLFQSHGGWSYFGDPEYEDQMTSGFAGHINHVGRVCFIYLIFTFRKSNHKILSLFTLSALAAVIVLIQIKYLILYLVLMTFIYYNAESSPKRQLRNLALAALTLLVIFNLFWVLLKIAWGNFGLDNEMVYLYIARQTANYLASGSMLLDHWLNYAYVRPDWTLWVIPENLQNVVTGNPIRYSFVPMVSLGFEKVAPLVYSNVGTAYGSFYLIGGWPLTLAYSAVTGVIYYTVYFFSYIRYRFDLIFLNLMLLTITTMSFFGQYYTILSTYEMPVIFIMMGMGFKLITYIRTKILY